MTRRWVFGKVSTNTPSYWTLINNDVRLPPHSYSMLSWDEHFPLGSVRHVAFDGNGTKYTTINGTVAGNFIGGPAGEDFGMLYQDDLMQLLRSKILSKLASNKASLGEFVGEFRQCQNLFLSTAQRILRAAILIRSFRVKEAAYALGWHLSPHQLSRLSTSATRAKRDRISGGLFLSNMWLEFRYGWQPLLSDLFGVAETLAEDLDFGRTLKRIAISKSYQSSFVTTSSSHSLNYGATDVSFTKWRNVYKIVIYYRVTNPNAHLREQLGLNNPLQIAWNLLPYGYIVDWFVNVNSFLAEISATSGLTFHEGTESWAALNMSNRSIHTSAYNPSSPTLTEYDLHCSTKKKEYRRTVLSSFPTATIRWGSGVGWSRGITAVALLRQRFR
jgi:hypothetical protein